jgi:hypothetical protein
MVTTGMPFGEQSGQPLGEEVKEGGPSSIIKRRTG